MKNAPQTEENPPPAPHPLDALRAYVAQCVAAYTGHLGRPGGIWSAEDYAKAVASKECLALATEALAGSRNNEGDTDMTMTEAMHDPHARALALAPTLTEEQRHWLGRLADGGLDVPAFGYLDGPECKSLAATGLLSCTSEVDMFGELLRYEVTPLGRAVLAVLDAPTGEPEPDCAICGWPLYASTAQGCTAASCSYRPNVGSAEWLRIQKRKEDLASKPSAPEQAAPSGHLVVTIYIHDCPDHARCVEAFTAIPSTHTCGSDVLDVLGHTRGAVYHALGDRVSPPESVTFKCEALL